MRIDFRSKYSNKSGRLRSQAHYYCTVIIRTRVVRRLIDPLCSSRRVVFKLCHRLLYVYTLYILYIRFSLRLFSCCFFFLLLKSRRLLNSACRPRFDFMRLQTYDYFIALCGTRSQISAPQ